MGAYVPRADMVAMVSSGELLKKAKLKLFDTKMPCWLDI